MEEFIKVTGIILGWIFVAAIISWSIAAFVAISTESGTATIITFIAAFTTIGTIIVNFERQNYFEAI